jgi:hypothetical protein
MIDIDTKIKNEINEYAYSISNNIEQNYSIYQPINVSFTQKNNNDLELLKLLIDEHIEGYLYTKKNDNSSFNKIRNNINVNVDRYGKRSLNNDVSIVDKYYNFWRKCIGYEDNIILYFNYDKLFLQKIFKYCTYPNILSNPRSILGSRIESIRKKVEKIDNIFAVSLSYNQESLLFFATQEIQKKILENSLNYTNWAQGGWRDTSWQLFMKEKYQLDSTSSLPPFKLKK